MAADKVLERAWGKPKEQQPDRFEKRYSDMTPQERRTEFERIARLAREVIDQAKLIEGEAERFDVLDSTE
jgi:hypothetical protein